METDPDPDHSSCMIIEVQQSARSTSTPAGRKIPKPKDVSNHVKYSVYKTLATAATLANLLPTGTVLAFRTLTPSFANKGSCRTSNRFLTGSLVGICAIASFFSSFTDSFVDRDGKLCYGVATFKGLYVFNKKIESGDGDGDDDEEEARREGELAKFRISRVDFVHAFVSLFVFLIYAFSDSEVQSCFFFPQAGKNMDALVVNLPLGAGFLSSFLFMIFPTTRRGIGYADLPT